FIGFFENHRLLDRTRPSWRTVKGGSRRYVEALTAPLRGRMRVATPVTRVLRHDLGADVKDETGRAQRFDQVIIATHSDEALRLLGDATPHERDILSAIAYRGNDVYLHRDPRL